MLNENFVYLGVALSFLGALSYLIDTLKGRVQPNKVSWFVWSLAPLVAFWATVQQGVGVQSLLTFMAGFNPLLIFLASFVNKKAYWKITRLDLACGSLAIAGLVLWKMTDTPNLAIFFGILADAIAAIPTVIKSFEEPETENPNLYLGSSIAALITLLTIKAWHFEQFAFPAYIFGGGAILFVLIKFQVGKKWQNLITYPCEIRAKIIPNPVLNVCFLLPSRRALTKERTRSFLSCKDFLRRAGACRIPPCRFTFRF
jgi:hypothetical protein